MATLLKVLNNLADIKSAGVLHFASELRRIEARQRFVRDELGIPIRDSILPLSSTPLCLPPFWLAAGRLLALA